MSVVAVTHDELVTEYADRTVELVDGRLADRANGEPGDGRHSEPGTEPGAGSGPESGFEGGSEKEERTGDGAGEGDEDGDGDGEGRGGADR